MKPELLTCETPHGDGKTTFPMGRSIKLTFKGKTMAQPQKEGVSLAPVQSLPTSPGAQKHQEGFSCSPTLLDLSHLISCCHPHGAQHSRHT